MACRPVHNVYTQTGVRAIPTQTDLPGSPASSNAACCATPRIGGSTSSGSGKHLASTPSQRWTTCSPATTCTSCCGPGARLTCRPPCSTSPAPRHRTTTASLAVTAADPFDHGVAEAHAPYVLRISNRQRAGLLTAIPDRIGLEAFRAAHENRSKLNHEHAAYRYIFAAEVVALRRPMSPQCRGHVAPMSPHVATMSHKWPTYRD